MQKVGIGIVGLGTVGVSFCRLLELNSQSYLNSFGVKIHIEVIGVKNTKKSFSKKDPGRRHAGARNNNMTYYKPARVSAVLYNCSSSNIRRFAREF